MRSKKGGMSEQKNEQSASDETGQPDEGKRDFFSHKSIFYRRKKGRIIIGN